MGYEDLEVRMGRLESEVSEIKETVASIKSHVTNHIPTALTDVKIL